MTTFREVVRAAVVAVEPERAMEGGITPFDADALAKEIADGLKVAGFSIHRSGECVHPRSRAADLGRPMTEREEQLVRATTL